MNRRSIEFLFLLAMPVFLSSCILTDEISLEDRKIADARSILSRSFTVEEVRKVKDNEPDFVPEAIAQEVVSQLSTWGGTGLEFKEGPIKLI
jgi:hypothetical protein